MQRILTDPAGKRYVQLVISDLGRDGTTMSDESFVSANGNAPVSGIALQQVISSTGANNVTMSALFNTGWAAEPGLPAFQVNQSVSGTFQGVGFQSSYAYLRDADTTGNQVGSYMDVDQRITNSSLLSANPTTGQDVHVFVTRRASGVRVPSAGSATLPNTGPNAGGIAMGGGAPAPAPGPAPGPGGGMGGAGGGMGGAGGGMGGGGAGGGAAGGGAAGGGMVAGATSNLGGTVSWQAGDDVRVTWIGQICDGCVDPATVAAVAGPMGGAGGMGGVVLPPGPLFSYQAFDNLSDNLPPIYTFQLFTTTPFTWSDPPFGPQPAM